MPSKRPEEMRPMGVIMFDEGVDFYEHRTATVEVAFPEGYIRCQWCKYLRSDKGNDRHYCVLTGDLLYSIKCLGDRCPFKDKEE